MCMCTLNTSVHNDNITMITKILTNCLHKQTTNTIYLHDLGIHIVVYTYVNICICTYFYGSVFSCSLNRHSTLLTLNKHAVHTNTSLLLCMLFFY